MKKDKIVEIVSVGTELLLGNIVNTNAAFLAKECAALGFLCYYQTVVGDNEKRLEEALDTAVKRSDVVILSGGLGPTEDDLTKEVCAQYCKAKLELHDESMKHIEEYFAKRGIQLTDNNRKQALIPNGSIAIQNKNGTAPGIIMKYDNTHIIMLPGPPGELEPMFKECVKDYLMKITPGTIVSQMVKICGVGESVAETMIRDLIDKQTNPTIATYAKVGEVHIRVTAYAKDEAEAKKLIKPVIKEIKSRFENQIYTTDDEITLEKSIVDLLNASDLKITTVESCTGGLVASKIIGVPGASDVFKYGLVTYSNKAKRKLAGVKRGTIDKYTAVSAQTAREMAKGGELGLNADVVVSVTGYAGPAENTDDPVGLVYIACNVCGNIEVKEFNFTGNRDKIRESAAVNALILARKCILDYYSEKNINN